MTAARNAFALLGAAVVAWLGYNWVTVTIERRRRAGQR